LFPLYLLIKGKKTMKKTFLVAALVSAATMSAQNKAALYDSTQVE
jgi:hypothetical protein